MRQMWFRSIKFNGDDDMNDSRTDRSYYYYWYFHMDLPGLT